MYSFILLTLFVLGYKILNTLRGIYMKNNNGDVFENYKMLINEAINDLKTKGRRYRQIPNILTLMRLTAPCFIIPAAVIGNVPLVVGLTAFFGLTDFADGFIARKWNLGSDLGAALDGTADKLFAVTLLSAAAFTNPILLCNLGLEAAIAGITVYKKISGMVTKSSLVGKLKTWFLFSLVGIGIISSYFDIASIFNMLFVTTTVMQVATVGSYLVPILKNNKLELKSHDDSRCLNVSNSDVTNEKELQKEKVIDDTVQCMENETVRKLNDIKEFLISEQEFLETNKNELIDSKRYDKVKRL